MAIDRRGTAPDILHSDRGSLDAMADYRALLVRQGIRQSMSRKADCWDNAPMGSFFHTLKTELVRDCDYKTREQARSSLFEYMEVFYNRQRRHSSLGYASPLEFEAMAPPSLRWPPFLGKFTLTSLFIWCCLELSPDIRESSK